jgi:hypothetical protein
MKSKIIKGLFDFLNYVHSFEDALIKKYNISDIRHRRTGIRFSEIGTIEIDGVIHNYRFHGGGCNLDNGILKLEFSMNAASKNKYYTVPRDFMLFIQSNSEDKDIQSLNSQEVLTILTELRDEGILEKSELADTVYELNEQRIIEAYNKTLS